jgi:hypothetical protein
MKNDEVSRTARPYPRRERGGKGVCLGFTTVLELRPSCECCDRDLPPDSPEARICTYECTFCADCVEHRLGGVCPNCGGNFEPRPIRPAARLLRDPASTLRVHAPEGCAGRI